MKSQPSDHTCLHLLNFQPGARRSPLQDSDQTKGGGLKTDVQGGSCEGWSDLLLKAMFYLASRAEEVTMTCSYRG